MDRKFIYIITVMERFNKEVNYKNDLLNVSIGSKRVPVLCESLEMALEIIENNMCDIQERCYNFACIEKIELNEFYPCAEKIILFRYDYEKGRFYQINETDFPTYSICDIG
jgi:hypothetical protein